MEVYKALWMVALTVIAVCAPCATGEVHKRRVPDLVRLLNERRYEGPSLLENTAQGRPTDTPWHEAEMRTPELFGVDPGDGAGLQSTGSLPDNALHATANHARSSSANGAVERGLDREVGLARHRHKHRHRKHHGQKKPDLSLISSFERILELESLLEETAAVTNEEDSQAGDKRDTQYRTPGRPAINLAAMARELHRDDSLRSNAPFQSEESVKALEIVRRDHDNDLLGFMDPLKYAGEL